jgi:hypothetical protein
MFDILIPRIPEESKVVIGIGDSFTHGIGSWSKKEYDQNNGFINPLDMTRSLEITAYRNSWVNKLADKLSNHIPLNFGRMGVGNRGSVKELYLTPKIDFRQAEDGVLVFLLSGMERFDFVEKSFTDQSHFYTMWPNPGDPDSTNQKLWNIYASELWSEKFVVTETLLNIKEAETFCRAYGYKFIVASAFDQRVNRDFFKRVMGPENLKLVDSIRWKNFLYPRGYQSFLELLLDLEGRRKLIDGGYIDHYSKLKYPSRYITNCCHPTEEGYEIIAEEFFKFIQEKGNSLYV